MIPEVHAGVLFFVFVTIVDLLGVVIICAGLLRDSWRLYPSWHKAGLITAALGLFFQAGRNVEFLATGVSPSDADLPLWFLKDLGISTVAIGYATVAFLGWRRASAEAKPTALKKTPTQKRKPANVKSPRSSRKSSPQRV